MLSTGAAGRAMLVNHLEWVAEFVNRPIGNQSSNLQVPTAKARGPNDSIPVCSVHRWRPRRGLSRRSLVVDGLEHSLNCFLASVSCRPSCIVRYVNHQIVQF